VGIYLNGIDVSTRVQDSLISDNDIRGNSIGIESYVNKNIIYSNNVITSNTSYGIESNAGTYETVTNNTVTGNTSAGIYAHSNKIGGYTITGNTVNTNGGTGITLAVANSTVSGNSIYGNTGA